MFIILISLLTGFVGFFLGSAHNFGGALGIVGFLCPALFLLEKMYIKLEDLEARSNKRSS